MPLKTANRIMAFTSIFSLGMIFIGSGISKALSSCWGLRSMQRTDILAHLRQMSGLRQFSRAIAW